MVQPKHWRGPGRLVPLSLVDATAGEIRLRCATAEFEKLDLAEETQLIPGSSSYAGYGPEQEAYWPYYGMGLGMGPGGGMGLGLAGNARQTVTHDSVPPGEVEIHRGQHGQAADGYFGRSPGPRH